MPDVFSSITISSIDTGRRIRRLAVIMLCSLSLAGCDKCGHWLWSQAGAQGVPLSCHAGPSPSQ